MCSTKYIFCFVTSVVLLALTTVQGLSSRFDELAQMGEEAVKAGNYREAIRHYETIVEEGPTYQALLSVKFDLGWCYYLTQQPKKAIPLFEHLSSKRSPSEAVKQQSLFLLAECHARVAADEPEGSDERAEAANKAIELHTKFQREYKDNPNIPQSIYGRGYAHFLNKDMDKAEADLRTVISRQPGTQTARDARFLLASVYSTQGLEKHQEGDEAASEKYIERARELFTELAAGEGVNLGMANDSIFSLAETWFAAGEYLQAIRYYQQMRSKQEVIGSLESIQEQLRRRLTQDMRQDRDTTRTREAIDRIRSQVREAREQPDMMLSGFFRIADAFYRQERFDEMRTVCRHIMDFSEGEQKQQALYMIINAYLSENDVDAAVREYHVFQELFGYDVAMIDTVAMSIGQLYLAEGDVQKAIRFLGESVDAHAEGRGIQEAMYLKIAAEYMDQQYEKALVTISKYLDEHEEGAYVANALYYRAMCQSAQKQWDEAIASINEVIERFPEGTDDFINVDEAFYQKGWMLNEIKEHGEAVAHLEAFLERFDDSALRPEALYQLGIALSAVDEMERAETVLLSISEKFPDHRMAPVAMYQVAVLYFEKEDLPGMAEALTALVEAYPDNPIVVEGCFWLGWVAMQEERYDDAVEHLTKSVEFDPNHALAPEAVITIARAYQGKAGDMGLPTVLGESQRVEYKATILKAAGEFENLMVRYPGSSQAFEAVPEIAEIMFDLVRYRQKDEEEAVAYFTEAMERHPDDPNTRARLCYSKGSFLMKSRDREKALEAFRRAFSIYPDVMLSPVMLTEYAEALQDAGELDEAETIYARIVQEHHDDPRVLAPAWYGLANISYRKEDYDRARELFEKVLNEFEWYERGREGRVMLAKILEQNEEYEAAEKMFEEVWKQETGIARLGAMLGVSRCQLAQAKAAKEAGREKVWRENIRVADENLTRIIVMFEAYTESVAEALWLKGNAYELVGDRLQARETYSRLVLEEEYRGLPWTGQARERLKKIGGILAPSS